RLRTAEVVESGRQREAKEEQSRAAFASGELSIDRYDLRPQLDRLGVRYVRVDSGETGSDAAEQTLGSIERGR
ncbi:MAG TPA: hypothetical protein VGM14_24910, partial [Streptosporangiaceae bacterium]